MLHRVCLKHVVVKAFPFALEGALAQVHLLVPLALEQELGLLYLHFFEDIVAG